MLAEVKPDTTGWRRTLACSREKLAALFHHWRPALFMACLLHLPAVKSVLVPLENGAQAWASSVQHLMAVISSSDRPQAYGVVLISPERFETQYAGRRPLPRTALLNDLKQMPPGTFVALDIDISPMPDGSPGVGPSDDERTAEGALYEHIKKRPDDFALILPFPVQDPANRHAKALWLVDMCVAGVTFADPRIELTWGVAVRELTHAELSLAQVIRHALEFPIEPAKDAPVKAPPRFQPLGGLCDEIAPGVRFRYPLAPAAPRSHEHIMNASILLTPRHADAKLEELGLERCKATSKNPDQCDDKPYGPLLPFGKGHEQFTQFSWCAQGHPFEHTSCGARPVAAGKPQPRVVIFGGDYDAADRFATPLGLRPGAYLHAISVQKTPIGETHLAGLLADFALGLGFGLVAHELWALWFDARRRRTSFRLFCMFPCALTPQTSWVALTLLAVSLSVLTVLALLLAVWLLVSEDLWLSPIPMMMGMTLDAMVLGSAGAAAHKIGDVRPYDDPPPLEKPGLLKSLSHHVPQLLWWTVVVYVLGGTVVHKFFH